MYCKYREICCVAARRVKNQNGHDLNKTAVKDDDARKRNNV